MTLKSVLIIYVGLIYAIYIFILTGIRGYTRGHPISTLAEKHPYRTSSSLGSPTPNIAYTNPAVQ